MLRVLQHVKAFHTTHGGVERVVEELVPELNRLPGTDADVLCQGPSSSEYALVPKGRVYQAKSDISIASATLSREDFTLWSRLAGRYDVVHVHAPWPQSAINCFFSGLKGALVVHWHSDVVRQRFLYSGYKWFERSLLKQADRICVTSPKLLAESAVLADFRHKTECIPIGIPEAAQEIGDGEIEELAQRFSRRPIVFALGRLVPYKGFEYLVRAARLLTPEAMVLIAGEGPLRAPLEALIRQLGVNEKVRLLGRVGDRDVEVLMRACSVFCLPSVQKSEAFGIVQLEAMRSGRPVVSTRIYGSGVDWVNVDGETGLTVEIREPAALARALNELLQNPSLAQRMGARARRRYEEHFTAQRMAERVRDVYRTLRI